MTRRAPPRPRSVAWQPRYPRAIGGAMVTVTIGLASACGGAGDPYDAPHWNPEPWVPIDGERDAGACTDDAGCSDAGGAPATTGGAPAATGGAGVTAGGAGGAD